ncbi:hypothetical protein HN014_07970 [Aquimarina sp. TRL1]|uniref:helix-turn-helix domain-containing protein n=1 Tax=Aquimarina sp. (strain TRL1) TaxID=2736252 RepID=UPI00158E9850|nr:hypothetical protein [Aquimarina sp. TRL1]QKX04854.1 hypothetical protein HN014_07970 [Aquimarina sp. TRL1]
MNNLSFKELRTGIGLTQKEVAGIFEISLRSVQNYEYDNRKVPHPIMKSLQEMYISHAKNTHKDENTHTDNKSVVKNSGKNDSGFISEEVEAILNNLPKKQIVAYIEKHKQKFEEEREYNLFVKLLIKDGVIKELLERLRGKK